MSPRPQRALIAAGLVIAVLTGAFTLALLASRDRSRDELDRGFAQRASISAALVGSVLKQSVDTTASVNAKLFAGARITDRMLLQSVQVPGQSVIVTDARGRALAAWPPSSAPRGALLPGALGAAARRVAAGTPFLVRVSPAGEHQISLITGVDTPHGRRAALTIFPRMMMLTFFGPYLSRISGSEGAAYLVDSAGILSSGGRGAGELRRLPSAGSGSLATNRGVRRYAAAPVDGTDWSVIVTTPPAQLYAPVQGLIAWLPWVLLIGMVAMAWVIFVLVRGVARSSQRLAVVNRELALRNAEVVAADRMKTDFLATMSHELRTPLNGIIGFAELMHDGRVGPVSDAHREYLGDILASSAHLRGLIDDVLDLSKIEAGKIDLRPEVVDCGQLVDEVCDVVRSIAVRKRIALEAHVDQDLEPLELDPGKLKQVLFNFLSNALKFTPEGGTVSVVAAALPGDRVRITVTDNGPGIAPEDLDRLWSAFRQLDSGSARRYGGSGLGLSLTRSLVEAQGGEVSVDSTVGIGSSFHVVLPRSVVGEALVPDLPSHPVTA